MNTVLSQVIAVFSQGGDIGSAAVEDDCGERKADSGEL